MKKNILLFVFIFTSQIYGQFNFDYNFNTNGRRVCLISATASETPAGITLNLLENIYNTSENYTIKRRPINGSNLDWTTMVSNYPVSATWFDNTATVGQSYEYQVSRNTGTDVATGYVTACLRYDQSNYKGRMILVIDTSFETSLAAEILQLKHDLTNEGWFVIEIYVPRATTWETENSIITVKNAIIAAYNNSPINDKPSHLFLLGHIPIARSGQGESAPDEHDENKGARGADCFYADIDGVYTDAATYNPGNIDVKAINLPNDLKWDQDYIPSSLEMAFGRVDFADIAGSSINEENLLRNYLNRLHNYRIVADGFDMGNKTAFHFGYDNSNDGSYRSLIPISKAENVDFYSGNQPFPQWVEQNGPYQIFMQNIQVPDTYQWQTYGMNTTIFSSDQSYWGFWDEPFTLGAYGKIRDLLAQNTKCLGLIYTTTGINIFHQPGMGETMGWSCKRIMDHSQTNSLYQKPSQQYDTPDYWNRTHFQYHGDPTLRLNQVKPPTNVQVSFSNGHSISWLQSTDTDIIGYHVYRSYTEFGPFERLTSTPTTNLFYNDGDLTDVIRYYLVKAIKLETTGSGTYLNPSIGIVATTILNNEMFEPFDFSIYPNPANNQIFITTSFDILEKSIYDLQGKEIKRYTNNSKIISIAELNSGIYLLKIKSETGETKTEKIIKF
ncbi:T9SS type A sorting domain-containing protein [Flavobacterium dankookense]|uniref:Putative secreted protein (Por secretion system target) n=1 Tax=Flavobacterium dankookense TaxID=706186 RepID=A0A4R6Q863_9FLAO|nr:T9SS type A sorting domain-containing protein [Flavobacterium dankookense]TDP58016.1 putative secreted protein (Por secretion system target) [Flavobacterium dankookense]